MFFDFCRRGFFLSIVIFVYVVILSVNGYFGGSLYVRMGGSYIRLILFFVKNFLFIEIYVKVLIFF